MVLCPSPKEKTRTCPFNLANIYAREIDDSADVSRIVGVAKKILSDYALPKGFLTNGLRYYIDHGKAKKDIFLLYEIAKDSELMNKFSAKAMRAKRESILNSTVIENEVNFTHKRPVNAGFENILR